MIDDLIKFFTDLVAADWRKSTPNTEVKITEFSLFTKLAIECVAGLFLSIIISSFSSDIIVWSSTLILAFVCFISIKFNRYKLGITKAFSLTLLHTLVFSLGVLLIGFARSNT